MFEYCELMDVQSCAFSGHDNEGHKRCGMAGGDNYINEMKSCPLSDNRKKLESRDSWKQKHYTVVELRKQAKIVSKKKSEIKLKKIKKILDL